MIENFDKIFDCWMGVLRGVGRGGVNLFDEFFGWDWGGVWRLRIGFVIFRMRIVSDEVLVWWFFICGMSDVFLEMRGMVGNGCEGERDGNEAVGDLNKTAAKRSGEGFIFYVLFNAPRLCFLVWLLALHIWLIIRSLSRTEYG